MSMPVEAPTRPSLSPEELAQKKAEQEAKIADIMANIGSKKEDRADPWEAVRAKREQEQTDQAVAAPYRESTVYVDINTAVESAYADVEQEGLKQDIVQPFMKENGDFVPTLPDIRIHLGDDWQHGVIFYDDFVQTPYGNSV